MKKFLAIYLLVLLPLQYSWAAMVSYCEHETSVTVPSSLVTTAMTMRQLTSKSPAKMPLNRRAWTMTVPLVIWVVPLPWSAI